jgi:two-component system nitrogen regulation response regulator GlnG
MAPIELTDRRYDFVLFDLALTGAYAPDLLRQITRLPRHPPVFVLSREFCNDFSRLAARNAVRAYFQFPYDFDFLVREIGRLLTESEPVSGVRDNELEQTLIGNSHLMKSLRDEIRRYGPCAEPVLIYGESGSGKDLVARMLHSCSAVKGAYRAFNVCCIPVALSESMLFGSSRGSYTDAPGGPGLFEEVCGGTLFLDEVGELELSLQPKFLRVLEDKRVCRLGSSAQIPVEFRLVCATNRDLASSVADGRFREDLYHRLDVLRLVVPPLREHPEDIPLLAAHRLLGIGKTLTRSALDKLHGYHWPGNVRQLFNCLSRAICLAESDVITPDLIQF